MPGPRELRLRAVSRSKLGAELREIDFLRVGGALGVFFEHHGAGEVLDGFFDDGVEDRHERDGLVLVETFGFEPGDEFERVEVVVFLDKGGGGEGEAGGAGDEGVGAVVAEGD